jgi:hypothetical protein
MKWPNNQPMGLWKCRSDDAYKGGGGRGDVDVIDRYEQYNTTIADLEIDVAKNLDQSL